MHLLFWSCSKSRGRMGPSLGHSRCRMWGSPCRQSRCLRTYSCAFLFYTTSPPPEDPSVPIVQFFLTLFKGRGSRSKRGFMNYVADFVNSKGLSVSRNPRVMLTKCLYCWQCPVALVLEMANHSNHGWETKDILGGPKKVCKSQNLRDLCSICFLRFGDQNQFPGPGLWHCWGNLCK